MAAQRIVYATDTEGLIMSTATAIAKDIDEPLGPRIRVAREKAHMSQEALARRLGVETASLVAWENGEKQPRANRLVTLCGVLDVSMKWLLEGMEGEYMQRGDDPIPTISAELERLGVTLAKAQRLTDELTQRVNELAARRLS